MSCQAILRYQQLNGLTASDELVTIDGVCDSHVDCVRVIRANGHPAWVRRDELEVTA